VRILVGMSGGVDSSLAAALLKEQGHEVVGLTLQLYDYEEAVEHTDPSKQNCHPSSFIQGARQAAQHLGIEHHVLDRRDLFREKIIDPFMHAYAQGRTPLPCGTCNREVKTAVMYDMMQTFQVDALATGHYVRRIEHDNHIQLHKGQDPVRDQSFFLFALTPEHLRVTYFPLGAYSKDDTRQQAHQRGLATAQTPASQDLCFIAKKSYKTLFQARPGEIVDQEGRVLGTHQGIEGFTIGQRQGLGLGGHSDPLYVVGLDACTHQVIVGPRQALARSWIELHDVNWLAQDMQGADEAEKTHRIHVKIRSAGTPLAAQVTLAQGTHRATVQLEHPDYAVAPGQACVFYDGTRILGGGWIARALDKAPSL
jgi:tRNA-specific 2-thiouridylase